MPKLHVGLLYGGVSSEHEISILSARNVLAALDPERYRVTPIRIDRQGRWHVEEPDASVLTGSDAVDDGDALPRLPSLGLDVAFPMLHGQNGEDGRVQGLLQTLGLPFVGPGVLASAVCMDKEVAKRLMRDAGLPVVPFRVGYPHDRPEFDAVAGALGTPLFVKPANSGSSVGTSKVENEAEFKAALDEAFGFDHKVLVEQAVVGREIECAVIGNEQPRVAVPGEVVSTATFYTYDAKYEDEDAARMEVPADLPGAVLERLRARALDAYRVLGCEGLARVDFFVTSDEDHYINEVNTIPGFTARSMFPVMWDAAGLPLGELVDTLIQLALDRHTRDARLKTSR